MLFITTGKPFIQNLNSYYLDIERLIEHYQGELGSGGIHFRSAAAEAAVFFDENTIVNVILQDKDEMIDGIAARDRLIKSLETDNFSLAIYPIDPAKIFFWANLAKAENFYQEPAAELTDLEELIKKMSSVGLTGYIDAAFDERAENGVIFFYNGSIVGAVSSWDRDHRNGSKKNLAQLIALAKKTGGTFSVRRIAVADHQRADKTPPAGHKITPRLLYMIRDLLVIFENLVDKNKKIREDFDTLLKKKFIEKADRFDFLDPFAAEFKYHPDLVEFTGHASAARLLAGIWTCVLELAEDLEMADVLRKSLDKWGWQYAKELSTHGIDI